MSITKRLCPQCGTQVQPGQNFCGNCGAPYSEPPSAAQPEVKEPLLTPPLQDIDARPAQEQQADPSSEETLRVRPVESQPAPPQSVYPTPGQPYAGQVEVVQGNVPQPAPASAEYPRAGNTYPPANGTIYPPVNGPVYPPAGASYPATGTASYAGPMPYAPQPAYGQPLPPPGGYPPYTGPGNAKKRINPLFIALGIVLIVLVALCSILAVNLSAVITPLSRSNSGNSVSASQTPLPPPTGKPIIDDNFSDNNNNWNLFQADGYGAAIQQHTLVMSEGNGKIFLEHIPGAQSITDFRMDMTYTNLQHDKQTYVGALFRRQSMPSDQGFRGYELKIAPDRGQYAIRKIVDPPANHAPDEVNGVVNLASGSLDASVQPDKQIQITLMVQGTNMILYVNGKLVTTCDDSGSSAPYDTGAVNLLLQGNDNGTPAKVAFSHFALYDTGDAGPSI